MSGASKRSQQHGSLPDEARTLALIDDLRKLSAETNLVEFKVNDVDPVKIGKTICALSNAARLADQHFGYMLWGIRDGDHEVVGTAFSQSSETSAGVLARPAIEPQCRESHSRKWAIHAGE